MAPRMAMSHRPSPVHHRRLLFAETILVVGLAQAVLVSWLMNQHTLPASLRVLLAMAITIGVFGGLVMLFRRSVQWGLTQTHSTLRRVPFLASRVVPHLVVWAGLFWGYAWYWGLDGAISAELWRAGSQVAGAATG